MRCIEHIAGASTACGCARALHTGAAHQPDSTRVMDQCWGSQSRQELSLLVVVDCRLKRRVLVLDSAGSHLWAFMDVAACARTCAPARGPQALSVACPSSISVLLIQSDG
jgi:hypothetical protein